MSRFEITPELATTAVFTVCADSDLSALAAKLPGLAAEVSFAGEFPEYITAGRQFLFPPSMKRGRNSVALIDFDRNTDSAIETAEALVRTSSARVTCVGVASSRSTELLLRAMRAGCSEFLQKPVDSAQLLETVERIQTRAASMMEASSTRGRVIGLLSCKGGAGASTLAVHLALQLVKRHNKKTLIVDFHQQLGHVCLYLGLKKNQYHFDQLLRNVERLDSDLLQGFLLHHASGLSVLGSPDACAPRRLIPAGDLERILEFLRHEYDFILFDASLQDDESSALIQFADEAYLVSTPDIASLRDLSGHIQHLSLSETAASRLRVVINRSSSKDAIGSAAIAKAVALPVSMTIPDGGEELQAAMNAGEPLTPQRRSSFATVIGEWAAQFAAQSAPGNSSPGSGAKRKLGFWK